MAVVWVNERWKERRGRLSSQPSAESTRTFQVKTDSILDDDQVVLNHELIPKPGDAHPNNAGIGVSEVEAGPDGESSEHWIVTVKYGSFGGSLLPGDDIENPLERPIKFLGLTWESFDWVVDSAYFKDPFSGEFSETRRAVATLIGEPYDPPQTRQRIYPVVRYTKNVAVVDMQLVLDYSDTVNSNQFSFAGRTVVPHQCLCRHIELSGLQRENNVQFYQLTFTFAFGIGTWDIDIPHRGLFRWNSIKGAPEHIRENGKLITKPAYLDIAAQPIAPPAPETLDLIEPVYLTFNDYEEKNFNALGIF